MKYSGISTLAALALIGFAGACASADALASKTPPSTLDAALADVDNPSLEFVEAWFSGVGVVSPAIDPGRCPFDATSQYFVCAPLTATGLTLSQRFTLLGAGGARQSAFGETTTTGLHLENSVSGTWAPDATTTTVDGQQTLDLTGLGSSKHTLNGTSLTLTSLVDPNNRAGSPVQTERKTTVTDLVIPVVVAGAPTPWPLSGMIDVRSRSVDALGNVSVSIYSMKFDGSSIVTLTMTVPGGIQTCRSNIALGVGCTGGDVPPRRSASPYDEPALR
jgi:hypothetical protein